jgi:protein phosphatase PTC7
MNKILFIKSNNRNSFLVKSKNFFCDAAPATNTFSTKIKYKFNFGFVKIPHFSKRDKGGEDALATHDGMLCVADGVGGWNEIGVDPSKYSKELCTNILKEYFKTGNNNYGNLKKIFSKAVENTHSQGSCTFCMCTLDLEKDYLHTLNMGDSGYMLIRSKDKENIQNPNKSLNKILSKESDTFDIVYKSEEQQHSFNFPYQVGTNGDDPQDAEVNVHKFKENDIIVLATDGLWDNLFELHILQILKPFYDISNKLKDLNVIAEMIGETCERYSRDERYKSPFSVRSRGLYLGGKPDDITIIVGQIVKNDLI